MTPELENYYNNRFTMMASQGWLDLIEDVKEIYEIGLFDNLGKSCNIIEWPEIIEEKLDEAALLSPVFLGAPSAPTAGISNISNQIARTEFVNDKN
jgi:hypothetical protein